MPSLASRFAARPESDRLAFLDRIGADGRLALRYDWRFWGRPEQFAPGSPQASPILRGGPELPKLLKLGQLPDPEVSDDWTFWLILAGRFYGKTRSGAEWAIEKARAMPGSHGALVAATSDDARKTMLSSGLEHVDGMSGILAISSPDFKPVYEPSKRTVTWPNGTVATLYTAEEPDRLRGPQHHWGWVDEIAAWGQQQEAWDQFLFGLRLGRKPQACITTTPRPIEIVRSLLRDPQTVITRGHSRENADNVAPSIFNTVLRKFEGTRLARQELGGELLEDMPGALWNSTLIDDTRAVRAPDLLRAVVAVDPAVTNKKKSDETGIIVAGVGMCNCKGKPEKHGFVFRDCSGKYSPDGWAKATVRAYDDGECDRVIAEVNNGGDLVETNIRTERQTIPYRAIHASRGKRTRAEPVSALWEQHRAHIVGDLAKLENEMCGWDPLDPSMDSPNRLDAMVYAMTELMLGGGVPTFSFQPGGLSMHRDREED